MLTAFRILCQLTVLAFVIVLFVFLGCLLYYGLGSLNLALFFGDVPMWQAITGQKPVWQGIWPAFLGTFVLVLLTISLAIIPGIGSGIYLAHYAKPRTKQLLCALVDVLAGTPSIIMGLFGFLLIIFLKQHFLPQANTNLLLAACCLAILVLPVIIVTTKEAIEVIPQPLKISSMALGISNQQLLRHILLPLASKGILSGVILAIGRAAEDTAVIMLTGVVANAGLPASLTDKFEALPFRIFVTAAEYQSEQELAAGFATAIVLLLLASSLIFIASCLEKHSKKRWYHLTPRGRS